MGDWMPNVAQYLKLVWAFRCRAETTKCKCAHPRDVRLVWPL